MARPLPSALECARLYLAPARAAFWCWSEDRSAIEWRDNDGRSGGTIMMLAEVRHFVADRVASGSGLPPMNALVFAMALLRSRDRALALVPGASLAPTDALWTQVKHDPAARSALIEAVLVQAPRNKPEFAAQIAEALAHALPPELFGERDFETVPVATISGWLRMGLLGMSPDRVRLLARTGLDDVPFAADLELPVREQAERLLQRLAADPEHVGLVGLVRQLMAAMRVPRLSVSREDHAMGGVAGLCNHGSLDRLALSELAQDDDVLAVRIALNEALYIEREVPQAREHSQRRVLLDAGVRMWGVSRVVAVALALALRATADARTSVAVWCARSSAIEPVDLASRAGLVRQLEVLDFTGDSRAALPTFFTDANQVAGRDEPIVIAHRDSVADPEFRSACGAGGSGPRFVAEIDEHGRFRLWSVGNRGWEVVAEAMLDLGRVVRTPAVPLQVQAQVPAYYAQDPEPLPGNKRVDGRLRSLTALALTAQGIVVRSRSGRAFLVRGGSNRVAFALVDPPPNMSEFGPAPVNPSGHILRYVQIGSWGIYHDQRGLLHFVPLGGDLHGLSLELAHNRRIRGWCSGRQVILDDKDLRARLIAIVESCA